MHYICGIFFILFPLITYTSRAEEITLNQLQGEWLNKQYVEELNRTKSPVKAYDIDRNTNYTAFYIVKKDSAYLNWDQSWGYHEGASLRITGLQLTSEPNTYKITYHEYQTHGRRTDNDRFFIHDNKPVNEIVWIFYPRYGSKKEEQRITFVRIEPSIEEFINIVVIAGRYTDEKGRKFEFKQSGHAIWPNKSFKYVVELDRYWTNGKFDAFNVLGEKIKNFYPMRYGLEWRDKKLLVFKIASVIGDGIVVREEKPLFILAPQ